MCTTLVSIFIKLEFLKLAAAFSLLISPSVLDRLNSLLEPGGALIINEQGPVKGKQRVIVPHKDFR